MTRCTVRAWVKVTRTPEAQRHGGSQIVKQLLLPAAEPVVVDLDQAIVASANREVGMDQIDLAEDLLVIQARVPHKAQLGSWKQRPRQANGTLNLSVRADKVGGYIGK